MSRKPGKTTKAARPSKAAKPTKKLVRSKPKGSKQDIIFGIHATKLALKNPERRLKNLYITEELLELFDQQNALNDQVPVNVTTAENIAKMLPAYAVHQGVMLEAEPLAAIDLDVFLSKNNQKTEMLVILLDQVSDPHNIGAILRSAAAFGADAVIMPEKGSPGLTSTMAKIASGAVEVVPIIRVVNLARAIETLKKQSFWVAGLSEHGKKNLSECDLLGRTALVMGAEDSGLRRLSLEQCDFVAKLPTTPPIASLNVSNAAAIALYEIISQRRAAAKGALIL